MYIPVILKNGKEQTVEKDQFQYLLYSDQICSFKRTNGWVVIGQDRLRGRQTPYKGKERRNKEVYSKNIGIERYGIVQMDPNNPEPSFSRLIKARERANNSIKANGFVEGVKNFV